MRQMLFNFIICALYFALQTEFLLLPAQTLIFIFIFFLNFLNVLQLFSNTNIIQICQYALILYNSPCAKK